MSNSCEWKKKSPLRSEDKSQSRIDITRSTFRLEIFSTFAEYWLCAGSRYAPVKWNSHRQNIILDGRRLSPYVTRPREWTICEEVGANKSSGFVVVCEEDTWIFVGTIFVHVMLSHLNVQITSKTLYFTNRRWLFQVTGYTYRQLLEGKYWEKKLTIHEIYCCNYLIDCS